MTTTEVLRLLLVGSLSSSEADSDGGVIGLAISLPLCLLSGSVEQKQQVLRGVIFIAVSTVVYSGIARESSVVGTAGVVTIVGVYGPLIMHFRKASPFGLVSMYRKNRHRHCAYRHVASIGGRSLDPAAIIEFLTEAEDGSDNSMVVDEGEQDFTNPTDRRKFGLEDDEASLKLNDSNDEIDAKALQVGD
ncbi:hypothetical protein Tco_0958179, partial [Tanacetum coccineum]